MAFSEAAKVHRELPGGTPRGHGDTRLCPQDSDQGALQGWQPGMLHRGVTMWLM